MRAWPAAVADRAAAAGRYRGHRNENTQRYLSCTALVFNVILTGNAIIAVDWTRQLRDRSGSFGIDLTASCCWAILLWLNTLSCHACRHAAGGRINGASTTFPPTRSEPILDYGYQDQPARRQLRLGLPDG